MRGHPEGSPEDARVVGTRLDDLEGQLNRRIETQQRELAEARHYFETVLAEKDRAVRLAAEEREKTAAILQTAVERATSEGDERLRQHISNQVNQLNAALLSSEKLEAERVAGVRAALSDHVARQDETARLMIAQALARSNALEAALREKITAVQRELVAAQDASKEAVAKADAATEKRFASVNEWRAQSADRERSQAEERTKLYASFQLREVAENQFQQRDTQFQQLRDLIASLTSRLDTFAGAGLGQTEAKREFEVSRSFMAAVALVVVAFISIVVTIALATHGFTK